MSPEIQLVSTPCTPWCSWQRINLASATDQERKKLKVQQIKARQLYRNALYLAAQAIALGGYIAWEWPRSCDAWRLPEVKSFIKHARREALLCGARRLHGRDKGPGQRQVGTEGLDDHDDLLAAIQGAELEVQPSRATPQDRGQYHFLDGVLSGTYVPEDSEPDPEAR